MKNLSKFSFLQYLLAVKIFFIAESCETLVNPNEISLEILPLQIGNTWSYEEVSHSRNDTLVVKSYDTMTVVNSDTLLGQQIYFVKNFIVPFYFTSNIAFYNQSNGLYLVRWSWLHTYPPTPPQVNRILKYPTSSGDTLRVDDVNVHTISTNASIATAAGNFQCVQYAVYQDTLKILETWISPGIGIVQMQYLDGNWIRHYSLISFDLLSASLSRKLSTSFNFTF
jgi:hypothetical protein